MWSSLSLGYVRGCGLGCGCDLAGTVHVDTTGIVVGPCCGVVESALDDLGLAATASASYLDVLVIGCQDGSQLRLEGVSLHFGICIQHRALVFKCQCIDGILGLNRNRVDNESTDVGDSLGADQRKLLVVEALEDRVSLVQDAGDCLVLARQDLELHHAFAAR